MSLFDFDAVLQVRVPTHEDGSCLFWEFASDSYDLGFGVYFEWTQSESNSVVVQVNESSDEEDEEEIEGNPSPLPIPPPHDVWHLFCLCRIERRKRRGECGSACAGASGRPAHQRDHPHLPTRLSRGGVLRQSHLPRSGRVRLEVRQLLLTVALQDALLPRLLHQIRGSTCVRNLFLS